MTEPLLLETKQTPDTVYFGPLTLQGNAEAMGTAAGCEEFVVLGSPLEVHLFTDSGTKALPEAYIQKRLLSAYICYIRAGMNPPDAAQEPIRLSVHVYTSCRAATPAYQEWYETDGREVKRITS